MNEFNFNKFKLKFGCGVLVKLINQSSSSFKRYYDEGKELSNEFMLIIDSYKSSQNNFKIKNRDEEDLFSEDVLVDKNVSEGALCEKREDEVEAEAHFFAFLLFNIPIALNMMDGCFEIQPDYTNSKIILKLDYISIFDDSKYSINAEINFANNLILKDFTGKLKTILKEYL